MEMKAIMMNKARWDLNLRENEEKAKEYQHLAVAKYNLPSSRLKECRVLFEQFVVVGTAHDATCS
jgi:hypothetical protein